MDRLDADRLLVSVIDLGSFARAAERHNVSPGQASKVVSRLESDLGVQLLTRTTRALSLTEAGQTYVERIRRVIEEIDAIESTLRSSTGRPSGRLRVTAPLTFGVSTLTPILVEFARAYPEIALDVSFSDRVTSLVDEGFDVAVRIGHPVDSSLIARKLCDIRVVLGAAPAYLDQHGTPAQPSALIGHECVIDANFSDATRWRFNTPDGRVSVPVQARMTLSNAESCARAAELGMGIARVPSFVAGPLVQRGALVPLLTDQEDDPIGLFTVFPAGRHQPLKLRSFVEFLAGRFRGQPEWERGW
ncbi:transcriptional regulator [Ketogulonicigenium robustum]|uniref:Transcriptional regulator n=1 Tax=Ketogulonicigenium robustum TaxID=92947 RepID=A0A1W6NXQ2_9RHOB|nr:LysR family transcriptional regulator [Ketogulonicigenium robustum]ARO14026.1 transcriptional regulator [Ketogulonicigenium robustum]